MFQYEPPFLDVELYRLITVVEASHALQAHEVSAVDERDRNIWEFLRQFEFPEVSRIVVSIAAIHRTAINANRKYYHKVHTRAMEREVGILRPDDNDPQLQESLHFREACNKVLHAEQVDLERDEESGALTGRLWLTGQLNKKKWTADLDLNQYALSALALNTG
jgi:hypothetical protein